MKRASQTTLEPSVEGTTLSGLRPPSAFHLER